VGQKVIRVPEENRFAKLIARHRIQSTTTLTIIISSVPHRRSNKRWLIEVVGIKSPAGQFGAWLLLVGKKGKSRPGDR